MKDSLKKIVSVLLASVLPSFCSRYGIPSGDNSLIGQVQYHYVSGGDSLAKLLCNMM